MQRNQAAYRGCLLGLAVGDAMGHTVDDMRLEKIQQTYGPGGLRGYDLCNGYADTTSNTQLAAYACNALLLAQTRGQMRGQISPLVKYVALACREWVYSQQAWGRPKRTFCWLLQEDSMCRRPCAEMWMMDVLSRQNAGTPEDPVNAAATPGSLPLAIGAGLFYSRERIAQAETDRLGAEVVALSHGSPLAFLSGAVLSHIISTCLYAPQMPMEELVHDALDAVHALFGRQYVRPMNELSGLLRMAVSLAQVPGQNHTRVMEQLHCANAAQVLAGAVYACTAGNGAFDESLILAVNHSGRSSCVGAITGAIAGLRATDAELPDFYVECLEPADVLSELADDLYHGCPIGQDSRFLDIDWETKYIYGGKH